MVQLSSRCFHKRLCRKDRVSPIQRFKNSIFPMKKWPWNLVNLDPKASIATRSPAALFDANDQNVLQMRAGWVRSRGIWTSFLVCFGNWFPAFVSRISCSKCLELGLGISISQVYRNCPFKLGQGVKFFRGILQKLSTPPASCFLSQLFRQRDSWQPNKMLHLVPI